MGRHGLQGFTERMGIVTDIHDLDQYVGRYVSITSLNGEGGSGYVTKVADIVDYPDGTPSRAVGFDWGGGWLVDENTAIEEIESPDQYEPGLIRNPIEVMHEAMHAADRTSCIGPECPHAGHAIVSLRAFRAWQEKQDDKYWKYRHIRKLRAHLEDLASIEEILSDARGEGAPPHIMDQLEAIALRALGER